MELPQFLGMENRPILQNSSIFFGYYEFQLQLSQGPGAKNPNGCTYAIGALKTAHGFIRREEVSKVHAIAAEPLGIGLVFGH